jgi:hypothetical protein
MDWDLHLTSSSPCIGQGDGSAPSLPAVDIDGEARVSGSAVDIGADEYTPAAGDTTPPVITLLGDNPYVLQAGTPYVDPGATATDDVNGDLSAQIAVNSSAVDTSTPGTYVVSYAVSDASGNEASASRTVNVVDTLGPAIVMTTPSDGATNVAADTNIVIQATDGGHGLDGGSISLVVQALPVTPVVTGANNASKTISYNPPADFAGGQEVHLTVTVADLSGNWTTESFSFMTASGSVWTPPGDDDGDGISNATEALLGTNPAMKTLFIRPKKEVGPGTYDPWPGFIELFPWSGRPGFAYISPLVKAGIEVSVIGDAGHPYEPMTHFSYDPATDPNHPACDILEIIYKPATSYCAYDQSNKGHTFFAGTSWSWDTKGYTPRDLSSSNYLAYGYHTPSIYPFPMENYFTEGAYPSIAVGAQPQPGSGCPYNQCWQVDLSSPLNVNQGDVANGRPDTHVEMNEISYDSVTSGVIDRVRSIGAILYDRDAVMRRTIVHEIGHGLLDALGSIYSASDPLPGDHCEEAACIMNENTPDWELHEFGANGCVHSPGGAKDIRIPGVVMNSVH